MISLRTKSNSMSRPKSFSHTRKVPFQDDEKLLPSVCRLLEKLTAYSLDINFEIRHRRYDVNERHLSHDPHYFGEISMVRGRSSYGYPIPDERIGILQNGPGRVKEMAG